jgi:hypothetical protein
VFARLLEVRELYLGEAVTARCVVILHVADHPLSVLMSAPKVEVGVSLVTVIPFVLVSDRLRVSCCSTLLKCDAPRLQHGIDAYSDADE